MDAGPGDGADSRTLARDVSYVVRRLGFALEALKGASQLFAVNPRSAMARKARPLHTPLSCARSEMDNRIQEPQLDGFDDCGSSHGIHGNQVLR
jgi:hypothetical protein